MNLCYICKLPSEKKCSICQQDYYCSKEHQKQDWSRHKTTCFNYKMRESPEYGRYLEASRLLKKGEIILEEAPLVCGPKVSNMVCLGCYMPIVLGICFKCPECGWPMCSLECARSPQHNPECRIITQYRGNKVNFSDFLSTYMICRTITTLRGLFLKSSDPDAWEKLNHLESHFEKQKGTAYFGHDRVVIAQKIRNVFKYNDFSEEEIMRIQCIITLNAISAGALSNDASVFYKASFISHCCFPNCSREFTTDGKILIKAGKTIKPGERLSICYTEPMVGTAVRRQRLMDNKFFNCNCQRCSDPTELGTHFSSLKCQNESCQGSVVPIQPLECSSSDWQCETCSSLVPFERVNDILSGAKRQIALANNYEEFLELLKNFEQVLHSNHYLLFQCKMCASSIFFGIQSFMDEKYFPSQLKFFREILDLVERLNPTNHFNPGSMMFSIQLMLGLIVKQKIRRREGNPEDLKKDLMECKRLLAQSWKLMGHPPDSVFQNSYNVQDREYTELLKHLHCFYNMQK